MFSMQMGLPPRFAGVTLLALGNGAADVSATINAIASDPENGYKMSLGALTGAAMFITTCIVGAVLVVNEGVRCRGAAVRDVMGLGVTLLVVGFSLGKGEVDRQVGPFVCCHYDDIMYLFLMTMLTFIFSHFLSVSDATNNKLMIIHLNRHPKHSSPST